MKSEINRKSRRIATVDQTCYGHEITEYSPEKSLFIAVLERAIKDAAGLFDVRTEKPTAEKSSALNWLKCDDADPFTFVGICNELEWSPNYMRDAIFKFLKRNGIKARSGCVFSHRRRTTAN